jgi:DNA-binding GntR family transcriptional regulator
MIEAHDPIHRAIVEAAGSPRIARAHASLATETRLFLVGLKPTWTPERMAADHERLPDDLEAHGPEALRAHLTESAAALLVPGPAAR